MADRHPVPLQRGPALHRPARLPFLEPLRCLAYLAGGTERIALGMSVLVMPWMVEEFDALGANFKERGAWPMSSSRS
jgi:hypothetical protein